MPTSPLRLSVALPTGDRIEVAVPLGPASSSSFSPSSTRLLAGDVVRAVLEAWPVEQRGEGFDDDSTPTSALAHNVNTDDAPWGLAAWQPRAGEEDYDDVPSARPGGEAEDEQVPCWDDLLPLNAPLPVAVPPNLALIHHPRLSRLVLMFLSVPSVDDGASLAYYSVPGINGGPTVERLIDDVCDRLGLVRRLTIGGQTRGRGRDKWGGGEKVVYALEEVWIANDGRADREISLPIPPNIPIQHLLLGPYHPAPSPSHSKAPSYRFCIPQSWLLRSAPPSLAPATANNRWPLLSTIGSSASRNVHDEPSADESSELDQEPTVRSSASGSQAPTLTALALDATTRPAPSASSATKPSARLSIFDSIYSTFASATSSSTEPGTPPAGPSASSSPSSSTTGPSPSPMIRATPASVSSSTAIRTHAKRASIAHHRISLADQPGVISSPILTHSDLPLARDSSEPVTPIDSSDETDETEFDRLLDDLNLHGPQRAAIEKLDPTRKAYLLVQAREKKQLASLGAGGGSVDGSGPPSEAPYHHARSGPRSRQVSGGPPTSFRDPTAGSSGTGGQHHLGPLQPQMTGGSSSGGGGRWSKRFSVTSLGGWGGGGASDATTAEHLAELSSQTTAASPIVKQDTGSSSWAGWWGGGGGATSGNGNSKGDKGIDAFVDELGNAKQPCTAFLKTILSLRIHLSTAPLPTIHAFLDQGGLDALEGLLGRLVRLPPPSIASSNAATNATTSASETGSACLLEAVRVVRVLSNTEPGFRAVVARPLLITYITFALHVDGKAGGNPKLRCQVADVLAALAVLGGSSLVLAAFSEFRVAFGETLRFEWLIESLRVRSVGGEDDAGAGGEGEGEAEEEEAWAWEWRASGMALVNALTNGSDELEERVMLRDELGRRGLNEVIVAMHYMSPPESLLTQLDLYAEEKQDDIEDLRYRTLGNRQTDDSLDYSLDQLTRLAQEHSDIYPVLVDTVKRYVMILERDIDHQLKADLLTVLDKFVEHAAQLDNLDEGWREFMKLFLQSVRPIVPEPGSLKATRSASDEEHRPSNLETIPSAFVEEIETLRTRVDELSEEKARLKDELTNHVAEVNTFRALPKSVSANFISPSNLSSPEAPKTAEKESPNFHGLVQRLVGKEKEVLRLQAEVARLNKSGTSQPREADEKAKRDRDRAKFNGLADDIQKARTHNAELEGQLKENRTEIKYLKLALESVHSRFKAALDESAATTNISVAATGDSAPKPRELDPQALATEAIESLTRKENEIIALRGEVEQLQLQLVARRAPAALSPPAPASPVVRSEKEFKARVAPPPPPPSLLPKPTRSSTFGNTPPPPPPPSSARANLTAGLPSPPIQMQSPAIAGMPSSPSMDVPPPRNALMAALASRPKITAHDETEQASSASTSPPRAALMVAISSRGAAPDVEVSPAPRNALMAALSNRGMVAAHDETAPSSPISLVASPSSEDPRTVLMASLRKGPSPPPTAATEDNATQSPPPRPNMALLGAINSRRSSAEDSSTTTPFSTTPARPAFLASISTRRPIDEAAEGPSGSSTPTSPVAGPSRPAGHAALMGAIGKRAAAPASEAAGDFEGSVPNPRVALMAALGGKGGAPVTSRGSPTFSPAVRTPPAQPAKKLKPFFWKKLHPAEVGQTVWSKLPVEMFALDLSDLEETFTMGTPSTAPSKMSITAKKNQPVTLLDITRSNNVGVMLARLKLPVPKIQQAILAFDDETLTLDDLKALGKLLPTNDEIGRINGFEDVSKLAKPDQYFKEIMVIPRLNERFECMLYRRRLEIDVAEVVPDLKGLSMATRELRDSERFKQVLQVVLAVGNALNGSTFRGGAGGFEMEALLKLKETRTAKPTPDCPTLLHFIAKLLIKTRPSLVLFIDELPHLPSAARISFSTVVTSVSSIVKGLDKVNTEIETLQTLGISPSGDRFIPVMRNFATSAAPSVVRIQKMGIDVDRDLKALLSFFGEQAEGPEATRPEDFFGMVLAFSLALQRAAAEVTKHLAGGTTSSVVSSKSTARSLAPPPSSLLTVTPPSPQKPPRREVQHGELDEAIRSLHGGQRRERERESMPNRDRPLSRIFLDGNSGGGLGSLRNKSMRGTVSRSSAGNERRGLNGLFEH